MPATKEAAPKDYAQMHAKYAELDKASQGGDATARADKVKLMAEIRQAEREHARNGLHLDGGILRAEHDSKKSLQEEYCRRFDDKTPIKVKRNGRDVEDTMRGHHRNRLLGK